MAKYYLGGSTLLSFQWELMQGQVEALSCFSQLLVAYLTELLAQQQEALFPPVIVQLLSINSQNHAGTTTVH